MLPAAALSRREMVCRLGNGFGALGLASVLAQEASAARPTDPTGGLHHPAKAKRIIFLFMNGGPSQVDTFDPKPSLVKYAGQRPSHANLSTTRAKGGGLLPSPFSFAKHGQAGIEVSELFPHVANGIDDICVIRSMHTNTPNHEPSLLMMNSGETQPTRPSLGSWLSYGLGSENRNLPGYVVLCPGKPVVGPQLWSNSFLPGVHQGVHIDNSRVDPKSIIQHLANRHLAPKVQRRQLDLLMAINERHRDNRGGDDQLNARIQSLELAYRMQFEAQEAFDISRESRVVRESYGPGPFADGCLIARRLVERGVRMVQLYYGGGQPWDDHGDILNHRKHAQASDQPIAALLKDLKQRGLLDDTIVVWSGEFGRTPASEGSKGRDHNNKAFTTWLAGGGFRGGYVHGATDEFGDESVENKVHVHDLHATLLHQLGINHEKLTFRYSGRDFRLTDVHGTVVNELLA